jgi:hypothetical protein
MSHSTSHPTPAETPREDGPAVSSALKATLAVELAEQASAPKAGGTATLDHLASPGRLHITPRA